MPQLEQYTLEAIAKNNGQNGSRAWIVLHDVVYDVTCFLDEHPGGKELILEVAGGDATRDFDDFGHSSDAKKMLKKFQIGYLKKMENGNNKDEKSLRCTDDDPVRYKNSQPKKRRKFLRILIGQCGSG